ncbi:MAG: hypothetical protein ACRDJE_01330 [Dehalococcoidia bacterium]
MSHLLGNPQPWTDLNPTPRQLGLRRIRYDVTRRFPEYDSYSLILL